MATDEYLCGLFDGEGCVTMSLTKSGCITLMATVVMCARAPVKAFHDRFGGRFRDGKDVTKTGRKTYRWECSNADAVECLSVFSSGCLEKHEVAAIALPVAKSMRDNKNRRIVSQEDKIARISAAQKITARNKPMPHRRLLDKKLVDAYLRPKTIGGGKAVIVDGVRYESQRAAGRAYGVSSTAIWNALNRGYLVAGRKVERSIE
jgi:hypothetical protein